MDLFKEENNSAGTSLTEDEFVNLYKQNAVQCIEERVAENKVYVTKVVMRAVIRRLLNKQKLQGVVLLINKTNILEAFMRAGFVPKTVSSTEYAFQQYSTTIRELKELCDESGLSRQFKVWAGSAKDGTSIRSFLADILTT